MSLYRDKVTDILANADRYHQAYYEAETFHGPSLFFHHRALQTRHPPGTLNHLEYVYATLASWGMHRMGRRGSKMQSFDTFRRSIECLKDKIFEAQKLASLKMQVEGWNLLKEIFQGIKIMASHTSLVANSKVMHHMLPNIVAPIDREYTLRYLRGETTISNDMDDEWQIMKGFLSVFFLPVLCDGEFYSKASKWIARQDVYPWDTSVLKVVDNLVIGSRK